MEDFSSVSIWAVHKATVRGKIIQISSQLNKKCKSTIQTLERKLQPLLRLHKRRLDPSTLKLIEQTRLALNFTLTTRAEKSLHWACTKFCIHKDKIGSFLAHKWSPKARSFTIPKLRCPDGLLSKHPKSVADLSEILHLSL